MLLAIELIESADDCNNAGPCCLGCPLSDSCPSACDEDD